MKQIKLGKTNISVPAIVLGCMRLGALDLKTAEKFIDTALELGINHIDHADIYGGGSCEELFGKAAKLNISTNREKFFIQSKCGIVPGVMYDFSKDMNKSITQAIQNDKQISKSILRSEH